MSNEAYLNQIKSKYVLKILGFVYGFGKTTNI